MTRWPCTRWPCTSSLRWFFCATALGLGACTGGDDTSGTEQTDLAVAERGDIARAIQAADTAVKALDGASSDEDVDAAVAAIAAARQEVSDAETLSAGEKGAFEGSIGLIEGHLALARSLIEVAREERRRDLEAERRKLSAALSSMDRISAVEATVAHGMAPILSGTAPGAAVAVIGLATVASGSTVTVSGWTGGTYTAADNASGTIDTVVLYTDIEAPGMQPFSGEGGKYDTTNGLAADGSLPIVPGTDATLIASPGFPSSAGIRTHEAGEDDIVQVSGTFEGADGAYLCTPGAVSPCESSVRDGGGYVLSGGGGWRFVPSPGAMVSVRDVEFRYFGWWLRDRADAHAVGVFHAGEGSARDEFAALPTLQGPARYVGPAVGKYSLAPPVGAASAGDFTATAVLKADFGDGTALGTIAGTVDEFLVGGEKMPWSVSLGTAGIGADGSLSADGTNTAETVWSIQGAAVTASGPALTWGGQLHEVDAQKVPSVATGAFEASYGSIGRMIGAFGATLDE